MRYFQEASYVQKGIAYHCGDTKDRSLYTTQVEIILSNCVDISLLQEAWTGTVNECRWLRATYALN